MKFLVVLIAVLALALASAAQAATYVLYHAPDGNVYVGRVIGATGGNVTLAYFTPDHLNGNGQKARDVPPCSATLTTNCYEA